MKILICDYPSEMQRDLSYEKQLLAQGLPGAAVETAVYETPEQFVRALDARQISAAGLDVLASEEPDLSACGLLGRDNVILTPHAAFYSDTSLRELARQSCAHIIEAFAPSRRRMAAGE